MTEIQMTNKETAEHDEQVKREAREEMLDKYDNYLWRELQSCGVSKDVFRGISLNVRAKIQNDSPCPEVKKP